RAGNEDRVFFRQQIDHAQVVYRRRFVAHLPRHPEALAHAARIRPVSDRAAVAKVLVRSTRAGKSGEMMALDHARETMTLGDAAHVDLIALLEHVGRFYFLARLEFAFAAAAKLRGFDSSRDLRLGKMPAQRRADSRQLALPEGHLHRVIAVGRRSLELPDHARAEL